MIIIKAAAAVLVFFVSGNLAGEYKRYIEKRISALEGFLSLLNFIKGELSCRLRTSAEWAEDFSQEALSACGFIAELRKTGNLCSAFTVARGNLPPLGEDATKLLSGYFSSFGKSYREEEYKETCRTFDELSRLLTREKSDSQKSVRAVRVLSYAVAVGVIILFL